MNTLQFCNYAHLFAKLPWPGGGEVAFAVFESSCHLLLPVLLLKGIQRQSR